MVLSVAALALFGFNVAGQSSTNQPPTVRLTAPTNGTVFYQGASIALRAEAADADGTVLAVYFFAGNTALGGSTVAPYTFTWTNAPLGTNILTARAYDNLQASTVSAPVAITVVAKTSKKPSTQR